MEETGEFSENQNASDRLRKCKDWVITLWEQRVRERVKPGRVLDSGQLRNNLPKVLDVMIEALKDPHPSKSFANDSRLALEHGELRAQDDSYSLKEVIREYHLLLWTLLEVLEEEQDLTKSHRSVIYDVIFNSIMNSASSFKRARDTQREKLRGELAQANKALKGALGEKSSEAKLKERLLETIFQRVEGYAPPWTRKAWFQVGIKVAKKLSNTTRMKSWESITRCFILRKENCVENPKIT